MSNDDVRSYKMQARLHTAPKSPLSKIQPAQTIRLPRRTSTHRDAGEARASMR